MSETAKPTSQPDQQQPSNSELADLPPTEQDAAEVKGGMEKSELVQQLATRADLTKAQS